MRSPLSFVGFSLRELRSASPLSKDFVKKTSTDVLITLIFRIAACFNLALISRSLQKFPEREEAPCNCFSQTDRDWTLPSVVL